MRNNAAIRATTDPTAPGPAETPASPVASTADAPTFSSVMAHATAGTAPPVASPLTRPAQSRATPHRAAPSRTTESRTAESRTAESRAASTPAQNDLSSSAGASAAPKVSERVAPDASATIATVAGKPTADGKSAQAQLNPSPVLSREAPIPSQAGASEPAGANAAVAPARDVPASLLAAQAPPVAMTQAIEADSIQDDKADARPAAQESVAIAPGAARTACATLSDELARGVGQSGAPSETEASLAGTEGARLANAASAETVATTSAPAFSSLFGNALLRVAGESGNRLNLPDAAIEPSAAQTASPAGDAIWLTLSGGLLGGAQNGPTGSASVSIATPVGDPGFGQDLARGMVYLARSGSQSAELSLHPANLGPVHVVLQMDGQQASLVISASHEATRSAMQEALPHLHALFEQSGLHLTGAQIGDGSQAGAGRNPGQQKPGADQASGSGAGSPGEAVAAQVSAIPLQAARRIGLVDTFA